MSYRIAGIDVHKKKLAVVVVDVEVDDEYQFERRWFGGNPEQLQRLAEWLTEQRVEEWNPLPNTGNRFGAHSNGTGNRAVKIGRVPGKCREHSIWRKHCPTADDAGARKTFRTRNVW